MKSYVSIEANAFIIYRFIITSSKDIPSTCFIGRTRLLHYDKIEFPRRVAVTEEIAHILIKVYKHINVPQPLKLYIMNIYFNI